MQISYSFTEINICQQTVEGAFAYLFKMGWKYLE
jgi:hypothetical protein